MHNKEGFLTLCYQLNWLQSMRLTTQHSMHLRMCASFATLVGNVVHICTHFPLKKARPMPENKLPSFIGQDPSTTPLRSEDSQDTGPREPGNGQKSKNVVASSPKAGEPVAREVF